MHFKHMPALVIVVLIVSCSRDNENTLEASGTIEGTNINVGSEVAGRILEVRATEGKRVAPGDTLAVVTDTDYQLQLRQALASEAAAEAQYRVATLGTRQEDLVQAEAAFHNAQKDLHRATDLLAERTITQKQFDDVYTRYVVAEQTYQKLRKGLREEEIAAIRARRDQASAQTALLLKKVADCIIVSPAHGIVTLRAVEPGELVLPGSNLFRISNLDTVKLTIYVTQVHIPRIRLGTVADIVTDAGNISRHEGRVVFISPVAEFTPKNVQTKEERTKLVFAVRIDIPNPDGFLKPGLPADATITLEAGG